MSLAIPLLRARRCCALVDSADYRKDLIESDRSIVQELRSESNQDDPANGRYHGLSTTPEDLRTLESSNRQHFKPHEVAQPVESQRRRAQGQSSHQRGGTVLPLPTSPP